MHRRRLAVILGVLVAGAALAWALAVGPARSRTWIRTVLAKSRRPAPSVSRGPEPRAPASELVSGQPDALRVAPEVVKVLGITTGEARIPERPRSLTLSGSLALDTNRLAHVHTRFAGEVVELGKISEAAHEAGGGRAVTRPLRFGDAVQKDQTLAVLWSSDLGEKKSEYIDSLSKLRLEKETLARLEELFKDQSVPERNVREARRNVESAQIAVARVERTLRSWRLSDAEIADILREAEAVRGKEAQRDPDRDRSWARVELRAPLAGTILEVNLAVGDIVPTDVDLFKIADMRKLRVWAYVYEEDLPTLLALPSPVPWTVRLKSEPQAPPILGSVEKIGDLIDPSQHTALVVGEVDNPDGRMRAGQFITAQIELPKDPNELEIPIAALIEDGQESIVFVQPDASQPLYSMHRVVVSRRSGRSAYLRGGPAGGGGTSRAGSSGALRAGDRVVVSGAVELEAALLGLQDAAKSGG